MTASNDDLHFLASSWATACGRSRHFVLQIVQVAARSSEVTCSACLASKEYQEHVATVKAELAAIEQHS
jgi:hypothetical protein